MILQDCMNAGIKDIIDSYSAVGNVLDEYGIGCGPCSVGTCLLKDIVSIHNLPADDEKKLMDKIGKIISGEEPSPITDTVKKPVQAAKIKYSPPMQMLVNEHMLIKRLLALIPAYTQQLKLDSEDDKQLVRDIVDFVRSYADAFHHAKEEDLLFKEFDEGLDIVQVILTDHVQGRSYMKGILAALSENDVEGIKKFLMDYRELLTEHITKEDEILYPWMDRNLSDTQVGKLFSQFVETDASFGDAPQKYENFVKGLEQKLNV